MSNLQNITARGQWPHAHDPERISDQNSNLRVVIDVPVLSYKHEDYRLEVIAAHADPSIERELTEYCQRAINYLPTALDAMEYALEKLNSVAFLSKEGDTRTAKRSLEHAIALLKGGN